MKILKGDITIPFGGWALSQALDIDQAGPSRGFVADLFRAPSALKKQACFNVISALMRIPVEDFLTRLPRPATNVSEAVRVHTARELAQAALCVDHVPNSYLRALIRIGTAPLSSPSDYPLLFTLCNDGSPASKAIQYCHKITSDRIHAALTLDERILSSSLLDNINSQEEAQTINDAVRILAGACSILDRNDGWAILRTHLAKYGASGIERMLPHADRFPLSPLAAHPALTPLMTSKDMERAGEKYRNCLKTLIPRAILGSAIFYVLTLDQIGFPIIVELEPLSNGSSRLRHMEGPKGLRLSDDHRKAAIKLLVQLGAVVCGGSSYPTKLAGLFEAFPPDLFHA